MKLEDGPKDRPKGGDGTSVKRLSRVGTRTDMEKPRPDSDSTAQMTSEWMAYKSLGHTLIFINFQKHMAEIACGSMKIVNNFGTRADIAKRISDLDSAR